MPLLARTRNTRKGLIMKVGGGVTCSECDEEIIIDETDLEEGEAFCPICGNWEEIEN